MSFDLLPYLRPVKASKGLYNIDLCFLEQEQQEPPKITFVKQNQESVQDLESLGITGSELVKQSFENLYKIEIAVSDTNKNEAGVLIFNQAFSAEKILDKTFTRNIATLLSTNKILVSIPVRNSILICDANDDKAQANLIQESQKLYHDFTKEPISTLVFVIEDGIITSAISPKSSIDQLEQMKPTFGTYSSSVTKTKLFQDLYNFRVLVESKKIEDLQNGLFYTILEIVKEYQNDKNFNNSIEIISSSDSIDKSREHVQKIRELFDKVAEKYHAIYAGRKEAIKLSFHFSQDFKKGDNHKKITKYLN